MDERTMQLRLGAAILASFVIIGILLTFLGTHNKFIGSSYIIYIKLADAPGVVENTPLYQSGILIGRVKSVSLQTDGGVLIAARIFGDKTLYSDQECSLTTSLLGDASLRIARIPLEVDQKPLPAKELKDGDMIPGRIAFDPIVLVEKMQDRLTVAIDDVSAAAVQLEKVARSTDNMMQENGENVKSIIENARSITDDTRVITHRIATVFDDDFEKNLQESVAQFPATIQTMNKTFANLETSVTGTIGKLNTTMDHVAERMDKSLDLVDDSLKNVQKITDPIAQNVPNWAGNINRILQSLDIITGKLQNNDSTLGLLISDRTLYDHLVVGVDKMSDLLRQAEPIVFNAQVFSEKIARHPELLGVRGALKPDKGSTTLSSSIPWPKGISPYTGGYQSDFRPETSRPQGAYNPYDYQKTPTPAPAPEPAPAPASTVSTQPGTMLPQNASAPTSNSVRLKAPVRRRALGAPISGLKAATTHTQTNVQIVSDEPVMKAATPRY